MKNETITHTITSIVGALLIGMAFVIADADNVVKGNQLDYFVLSVALFFFLSGIGMCVFGVVKILELNDPLHIVRTMQWSDVQSISFIDRRYADRGEVLSYEVEEVILTNGIELTNQDEIDLFVERFDLEIYEYLLDDYDAYWDAQEFAY